MVTNAAENIPTTSYDEGGTRKQNETNPAKKILTSSSEFVSGVLKDSMKNIKRKTSSFSNNDNHDNIRDQTRSDPFKNSSAETERKETKNGSNGSLFSGSRGNPFKGMSLVQSKSQKQHRQQSQMNHDFVSSSSSSSSSSSANHATRKVGEKIMSSSQQQRKPLPPSSLLRSRNEQSFYNSTKIEKIPIGHISKSLKDFQLASSKSLDINDNRSNSGKDTDMWLSFVTSFPCLMIILSFAMAVGQTTAYWDLVLMNQIPLQVLIVWVIAAFTIGKCTNFTQLVGLSSDNVGVGCRRQHYQSNQKKKFASKRILSIIHEKEACSFTTDEDGSNSDNFFARLLRRKPKPQQQEGNFRTAVNINFMKKLLQNHGFRRKLVRDQSTVISNDDSAAVPPSETNDNDDEIQHSLGCVSPMNAKCKGQLIETVTPLFKMRGLDVFLTNCAQSGMSKHQLLQNSSLRDKPTWLVNIMTPWANVIMYFELPDFVKDWNNIVEEKTDDDDVIAVKRFFNGTDEYRNLRCKLVPEIVEGPYALRLLAPKQNELTVSSPMLPVRWYKHDAVTSADGTVEKHCLFETDLDTISVSTMRRMSSLVERFVNGMTLDLALIITKPTPDEPDEPSACLGLWSFDKINLDQFPDLPAMEEDELELEANELVKTLSRRCLE